MKPKKQELREFIKDKKRKVKLENLNSKQGFAFEDERLLVIRKKIEDRCIRLGEINNIEICIGVKTGCNDAFIISEKDAHRLTQHCSLANEIIHKIVTSKETGKYEYNQVKYIIAIPCGWTNNKLKTYTMKELLDKINDILNHIRTSVDEFESKVKNRASQGDYWWETQYFDIEKFQNSIRYSIISTKPQFVYIKENILTLHGLSNIQCGHSNRWITAVLNSNIQHAIYRNFVASEIIGGILYSKINNVRSMIIPRISDDTLSMIVDEIQQSKQEGKPTDHLEQEVENIVQELYGLTDEEVEYLCK